MNTKILQNIKKGIFIIGLLLLIGWSCQNSPNNNKPLTATITGTTSVKGDKFEFIYNTFQFSFNYGEFPIQEDGSFNGEILIPEAVFGQVKIINDRRPAKTFSLFVKRGSTIKLTIGENSVEYEGELKKENEFLKKFNIEVTKDIFKFYGSKDISDFNKINSIKEKKQALLLNAKLDKEFNQFVQTWLDYMFKSIKYRIIKRADLDKADLPNEVLDFIKETSNEKFNSSVVMSTHDWRYYLNNYFEIQQEYIKNNPTELAERFTQIENEFLKDRYALYLSNRLINSNDGMDGTCRKQVASISPFIKNENSIKNLESLLDQLTKAESEYKHLLKGNPAPEFTFEDVHGDMVSLSDFKGKYVFLDVWNIYCSPCKKQIPYIKKYEEQLKDENIEFIAITCDREKDKQKWKDFVVKNKMVGHQLIMDKGRDSQFLMDYNIKGFPTFIIIDPDGNMVDYKFILPENKLFFPTLSDIIKE